MFFLFGKRAKTRPVAGARRVCLRCEECEATRTFVEVERETTYTAYVAIDLLSSKDRAFACQTCGALVDADDVPAAVAEAPPVDPEATRRAREADARKRAELRARRDREVDDELAALKKKLGTS